MMPSQIIGMWLRGLLSVTLLILGPYLLYEWYDRAHAFEAVPDGAVASTRQSGATDPAPPASPPRRRVFAPHWGFNGQTALGVAGLLATLWALPTGPLNLRRLRRRRGSDEPTRARGGTARTLARPDGSELRVEAYGPEGAPVIVLTHGWGLDSTEWYYAKKELAARFRLVVWDLPGLGLSKRPDDNDYSLENLARHLDAVVEAAGGSGPVVLMGHSIGGMITLTYCKLFPAKLGTRVGGLVLVNTTYTNPVRTTKGAAFYTAIQRPVLEPLMHLTIALSPLVWLMNWLSYLNGSAHRSSERSGFSGRETRGQLDFVASFTPRASPAVLARGMFGMMRYDATETLRSIAIPVLVVTGDKDPVCKPEASERMRGHMPAADLLGLEPAKHQALIEHHDQLAAAVLRFAACRPTSPP